MSVEKKGNFAFEPYACLPIATKVRKALFIKVFTNTEENFSQTQQTYTIPATVEKMCRPIQKHSQEKDAIPILDRTAST
jgi:hypothetical protein